MEYIYILQSNNQTYLTGVATDSYRLSSSSMSVENLRDFSSIILPRKTVFQLSSLLSETSEKLSVQTEETK